MGKNCFLFCNLLALTQNFAASGNFFRKPFLFWYATRKIPVQLTTENQCRKLLCNAGNGSRPGDRSSYIAKRISDGDFYWLKVQHIRSPSPDQPLSEHQGIPSRRCRLDHRVPVVLLFLLDRRPRYPANCTLVHDGGRSSGTQRRSAGCCSHRTSLGHHVFTTATAVLWMGGNNPRPCCRVWRCDLSIDAASLPPVSDRTDRDLPGHRIGSSVPCHTLLRTCRATQ